MAHHLLAALTVAPSSSFQLLDLGRTREWRIFGLANNRADRVERRFIESLKPGLQGGRFESRGAGRDS
jgi:hypothetical protein